MNEGDVRRLAIHGNLNPIGFSAAYALDDYAARLNSVKRALIADGVEPEEANLLALGMVPMPRPRVRRDKPKRAGRAAHRGVLRRLWRALY